VRSVARSVDDDVRDILPGPGPQWCSALIAPATSHCLDGRRGDGGRARASNRARRRPAERALPRRLVQGGGVRPSHPFEALGPQPLLVAAPGRARLRRGAEVGLAAGCAQPCSGSSPCSCRPPWLTAGTGCCSWLPTPGSSLLPAAHSLPASAQAWALWWPPGAAEGSSLPPAQGRRPDPHDAGPGGGHRSGALGQRIDDPGTTLLLLALGRPAFAASVGGPAGLGSFGVPAGVPAPARLERAAPRHNGRTDQAWQPVRRGGGQGRRTTTPADIASMRRRAVTGAAVTR
jgi:hypothetical protein